MPKSLKSYRLSELTINQLEALSAKWGTTHTETLGLCIDRITQQETTMRTFVDLIENGMEYSSTWGIWVERISPDSPARFGQMQFENGGLLDGWQHIGTNMEILDFMAEWLDGEDLGEHASAEEVAREYIDRLGI